MPTITFAFSATVGTRLLAGLGYSATIPNPSYDPRVTLPAPTEADPDATIPNPGFDDRVTLPNPETGAEFVKRVTIAHWKQVVRDSEAIKAANTAVATARADVDAAVTVS